MSAMFKIGKESDRVPPSPQKKKKISAEFARALIYFLVLCNAPPQAGRDVAYAVRQIPEREGLAPVKTCTEKAKDIKTVSFK